MASDRQSIMTIRHFPWRCVRGHDVLSLEDVYVSGARAMCRACHGESMRRNKARYREERRRRREEPETRRRGTRTRRKCATCKKFELVAQFASLDAVDCNRCVRRREWLESDEYAEAQRRRRRETASRARLMRRLDAEATHELVLRHEAEFEKIRAKIRRQAGLRPPSPIRVQVARARHERRRERTGLAVQHDVISGSPEDDPDTENRQ